MREDLLPRWDECSALADRGADLTPLQRFIYDQEPAGPAAAEFRKGLAVITSDGKSADAAMTKTELDLIRQWFDAVQDLNPNYLEPPDFRLAQRIYEALGRPAPRSVQDGCTGTHVAD